MSTFGETDMEPFHESKSILIEYIPLLKDETRVRGYCFETTNDVKYKLQMALDTLQEQYFPKC